MTADKIFGVMLVFGVMMFLLLFVAAIAKKKKWKIIFQTRHLHLVDPKQETKF